MQEAISLWPLIGIAVIVVGFVLRFNPVLVVIISGIVTGVAAHMPIATILEKLGEGFLNTRNLPFILLAAAGGDRAAGAPWSERAGAGVDREDP